jgi:NADPH-dependent 2,4-dienoyl-CoA reductase/sulfur reductase-like enzyme
MKIIIIGGVAGGATTAARLRRRDENAEIIMYEKGDYISYANCGLPITLVIPYQSGKGYLFKPLRASKVC